MIPYLLLSFTVAMALMSGQLTQAQPLSLDIMSYNIRYDNPDDAPNHWDNRKEKVANLIQFYSPVFVGTQEALFHQLTYLDQHLENYKWIGKGRQDGKKEGEFSALFYDHTKVKLIAGSDSTIWLSNTPAEPSKDWDAALPRVLTWGQFLIKETGDSIFVFNTHFDHRGETARAQSAKIILETIEEQAGKSPVLLTGDFNVLETSKPYDILTSSFLKDTYTSSLTPPVGPTYTFSGFNINPPKEKRRIDYIFANAGFSPLSFITISSHQDGYYPSDHLPIMIKAELQAHSDQD